MRSNRSKASSHRQARVSPRRQVIEARRDRLLEAVDVVRHVTFEEFEQAIAPGCVWCVETPGERAYTRAEFADGDCLLFGGESKGLPLGVRAKYAHTLIGIPMPTGKVRSLNLATAVGVVLYEALRQLHDW